MYNTFVASSPGGFQRTTLKSWVEPGDEAKTFVNLNKTLLGKLGIAVLKITGRRRGGVGN